MNQLIAHLTDNNRCQARPLRWRCPLTRCAAPIPTPNNPSLNPLTGVFYGPLPRFATCCFCVPATPPGVCWRIAAECAGQWPLLGVFGGAAALPVPSTRHAGFLPDQRFTHEGLRSVVGRVRRPRSAVMDFVVTVRPVAGGTKNPCPGQPMSAHWGVPDPLPWWAASRTRETPSKTRLPSCVGA